ncbi:MAG TPA: hypothetical protein VGS08_01165 [Candidatus Saccharimonadales bacterium]|nr:hypothetical protein [Candidatus Saccharimonadales bacterium]
MNIKSQTLTAKHLLGKKLMVSGIAVATTAFVGLGGVAAAQSVNAPESATPAIVAECKNPQFRQAHNFPNVGKCVSTLEHTMGHGHGYGSNTTVNANVNVNVNGSHDYVSVVLNFFGL